MDCLTFRKNIGLFREDRLNDEELNEFLGHLNGCDRCRDELEVNFIVFDGIALLDNAGAQDYNLTRAFRGFVDDANRYMKRKKRILLFEYILDSLVFWAVVGSALLCLRIFYFT